jgi:hypothetical protein
MNVPFATPGPDPSQQPLGQTPADQWRPAESDRKTVADRLRIAVDEGRLDLMEYDRRLRASETAATMAELFTVVSDLPTPPEPAEPALVQIGEITVTRTTAFTPAGAIPLRGSQWFVQDRWLADQKIPAWAIVLAILLFFCIGPFSLLFLLAKETQFHGTVDITISNGNQQYVARVPVQSQQQVHHLYHQVNYARSLAAW